MSDVTLTTLSGITKRKKKKGYERIVRKCYKDNVTLTTLSGIVSVRQQDH